MKKPRCPYCTKKAKKQSGSYYAESNTDKHYCCTLNRWACKYCGVAFYTMEAVDLSRTE